jgi:hypothetical protein
MPPSRLPPRNPFEYGRELGVHELVDREDDVDAVVETICDAGTLFLIGPRRFGKTSILNVAVHRAETENHAIVLRYDAEAYPRLETLAQRIVADASQRLIGGHERLEKLAERTAQFFGRLRPAVTIDAGGSLTVTFNVADGPGGSAPTAREARILPFITDALDGVNKLAALSKHPVAIVIDEFQQLVEAGREAEGQLRAAMQRHEHVGYVLAGSKTHVLATMTSDPTRPFYNMGQRRFVGPLPRAAFAAFLARGLATSGAVVDAAAVDRILDVAEEVPYNVQMLAHACWASARDATQRRTSARPGGATVKPQLTAADVDAAAERVVRRLDGLYTQWWDQLTPPQRSALVAFVEQRGEDMFSAAVVRRYDATASGLQRALTGLREKGILRDEERLGTVRLRLSDPFFGTWLRLIVAAG